MSKQSDAKAAQCYQEKPEKRQCSVCCHYHSTIFYHPPAGPLLEVYQEEKDIRCNLGGFKVKKTAVCNRFQQTEETQP